MANKITWPLAVSTFTFWDKLKISKFLFTEPIWTYGKWVREYEKMWEKKFDLKHAIMVSSGSTANELIALRRKHELQEAGLWPRKNKVVFPVNTWISSVSPWVNCGFEPVFVDVKVDTLNVAPKQLGEVLAKNSEISTVFYTTLLGLFDDVLGCKEITEAHGSKFLLDNCESSFSYYYDKDHVLKSILKLATSSTSVFFSHLTMNGTEGGFVFTESDEEAEWYRMARSHGLTRGMPDKYKNPDVSPDFDFYLMGSNYRSSNLQAYMGILDFERAYAFSLEKRRIYFEYLNSRLNHRYVPLSLWTMEQGEYMPLALPIICRNKEQRVKVEEALKKDGVLTRPLIGGCLLAHTAFKKYGNIDNFPNAVFLHDSAIYIGLNTGVSIEKIKKLVARLNSVL